MTITKRGWIFMATRTIATISFAWMILETTKSIALGSETTVPDGLFPSNYPVILGFDLRDDERPTAALVINSAPGKKDADVSVALPFATQLATTNERALFRYGGYRSWTFVTFSTVQSVWPQQITFVPTFDRTPDAYRQADALTGALFLENAGQIRHFRYRYPNAASPSSLPKIPDQLDQVGVDAIAVAFPRGSHELAVQSGRLTIPERLTPNESVFPALSPEPKTVPFLEIDYEVLPTDVQKIVVKFGVKFLAALLPISGLIAADGDQIRRPRIRRYLIGLGAILFIALLAAIIWASISSVESRIELGADLTLLVLSTIVSVLIARVKGRSYDPTGNVEG